MQVNIPIVPWILWWDTIELHDKGTRKGVSSHHSIPKNSYESTRSPVGFGCLNSTLRNSTMAISGGNSNIFGIFTPIPGVSWSNLTIIFFKWVETNHQLEKLFGEQYFSQTPKCPWHILGDRLIPEQLLWVWWDFTCNPLYKCLTFSRGPKGCQ